jgi:hypothetical protein
MPASAEEGRDVMVSWILDKNPRSLLDIGAGCGTYAKPWKNDPGNRPYLIGVEVFRPYVTEFALNDLYDQVIVRDIRELPLTEWPRVDVVVLGDVLEHMSEKDAIRIWHLACASANRAVYLSIPTVPCPQGPVNGNRHEEHVVNDWTHERVLDSFPLISWHWRGTIVGRYEADLTKYREDDSR